MVGSFYCTFQITAAMSGIYFGLASLLFMTQKTGRANREKVVATLTCKFYPRKIKLLIYFLSEFHNFIEAKNQSTTTASENTET